MSDLKTFVLGAAAATAFVAGLCGLTPNTRAETTITLWSHWADEPNKVNFVETAIKTFEAENPGVKVDVTWYQKQPLNSALKVALTAGKAPDVFYAEVDQTEYVSNNALLPLDDIVDWSNVEKWAQDAWTFNGKIFGFPLEATVVELYYNKDLLKDLGVPLPASKQFTQSQFVELVKASIGRRITPLAQGVGDRPFPGHYFTFQTLLKKLGRENYGKVLSGKIPYSDPRVVAHLKWVKNLIDMGLYPKGITTIKLGESHRYFHTEPKAVMLPLGSFYPGRAFKPASEGGQPDSFPLGIMQFPAMDGGACNNCKTVALAGSYVVNAKTKQAKLAGKLISVMARPEMGNLWLETVMVQSGVKGDPSKIKGKYAGYFKELGESDAGAEFFVGLPHQRTQGKCQDALIQVMNVAFPAGLVSVDEAVAKMDQACR